MIICPECQSPNVIFLPVEIPVELFDNIIRYLCVECEYIWSVEDIN